MGTVIFHTTEVVAGEGFTLRSGNPEERTSRSMQVTWCPLGQEQLLLNANEPYVIQKDGVVVRMTCHSCPMPLENPALVTRWGKATHSMIETWLTASGQTEEGARLGFIRAMATSESVEKTTTKGEKKPVGSSSAHQVYTGAYIDFSVPKEDAHPRVYPRAIDYTGGVGASSPVFWMHNATTRPWEWRGQSDKNIRRAKKRMSMAQAQAHPSKRPAGKGAGKGKGKGKGKGERPISPPPPHLEGDVVLAK